MVSRVIPVDSFDLVIFGGTGDLAKRKILPGLYRRFTRFLNPAVTTPKGLLTKRHFTHSDSRFGCCSQPTSRHGRRAWPLGRDD